MDSKALAQKKPMALPGFTVIAPKEETAYDKRIRAKQEKTGCLGCGDDFFPRRDYKSRMASSPATESNNFTAPKDVSQTDPANSKR